MPDPYTDKNGKIRCTGPKIREGLIFVRTKFSSIDLQNPSALQYLLGLSLETYSLLPTFCHQKSCSPHNTNPDHLLTGQPRFGTPAMTSISSYTEGQVALLGEQHSSRSIAISIRCLSIPGTTSSRNQAAASSFNKLRRRPLERRAQVPGGVAFYLYPCNFKQRGFLHSY